ncbi:MAG TPA: 30S ribosomal protein S16 [Elusimicrobia bacterium]|nr:MAG: 30S ribosomal protein S16 [Elusimicrobia bacterium GWF2_62_30]HBA60763.1 30S ribosomal protein S16 [Elusimicrobiota bacterium]
MAVVLRLQRIGKRTQPHYRIVAIEKSSGPHGQPLEVIGHYNPKAEKDKEKVTINPERLDRWVKTGAKPSETVGSLIARARKAEKAAAATK